MGVILAAAICLDWLARIMGRDVASMLGLLPDRIDAPSPGRFLPLSDGRAHAPQRPDGAGLVSRHDGADRPRRPCSKRVLEGVGFALKDCVDALAAAGTMIDQAYAVGGGSRSRVWLQIIADISGITLLIPSAANMARPSAGAAGAAAVAGGYDPTLFGKPAVAQVIRPDAGRHAAYAAVHGDWRKLYAAP